MTNTRTFAQKIFMAGVGAADPFERVTLYIDQVTEAPELIVAVGKAGMRMAAAGLAAFPGTKTIVVTNYENAGTLDGATVHAAGHPVPDENGAAAGRAVKAAVKAASGPVLALISGGGSALLPSPAGSISLDEKAAVNQALLGAGIDINEMNLVRQQLSDLKGGGLLRLASPHPVTALILSDVIGDDLSAIASGPTAAPLGDNAGARKILESYGIWDQMSDSVKSHLDLPQGVVTLPKHKNILIGSNGQSVAAMANAANDIRVIHGSIEGDVADAARRICGTCGQGLTVWGGETTVILKGDGRGGRNQELALRIAHEAKQRGWSDWTCLQGGSDGRDGPTDAAGGIVDQGTLDRISAAGGDLDALLANNDSYAALEMAGDLLMTDATGTNVADLGVMIRG